MIEKIIIPFGEECYTCKSLDVKFSKNNNRKCGLPFDYVGHTYIENIYNNILDLLNNNNFICTPDDFYFELFIDKYYLCHKKYNFKYWHDINTPDNTINMDNDIKLFIEKYNRRYDRLVEYLNNSNNIIILCVNHFDNIYNKKLDRQNIIYKLFNLIKSHNNNTKFIAVNFGEDLFNLPDLEFVNLEVIYNLPFTESKQEFTNNLYNFINTRF